MKRAVVKTAPEIDDLARLLADRSRAVMLGALMDGRQWTGRELADAAHVTPSTASLHLKRLSDGNVVSAVAHGRHKYYRITRREIGSALESLMALAPPIVPRHTQTMDAKLRRLRMCYDHLAGVVAVEVAERLVARGAIVLDDEAGTLTHGGMEFFAAHGIALHAKPGRRATCKSCLDWSERRYHLAGRAGAALAEHARDHDWIRYIPATRALEVTEPGRAAIRDIFGFDPLVEAPQ